MAGNIPIIPGSERVQDQNIGVKVNPAAGEQRFAAQRQVLNAATKDLVEGTNFVQDYEEKKQKAEEVATFNKASIVTNKTTEDFRHRLKTIPDQEIVKNWEQYAGTVQNQIIQGAGSNLTPAAKQQLQLHLDTWKSEATTEFQVAADKLGSQRRQATARAAAEEFLKTGDPALMGNAKAAVDMATKAGDWTPEQAKKYTDQFPERVQVAQAVNGINANPYQTYRDLQDGKFEDIKNPQTRKELLTQANARMNSVQSQKLQEVVDQINTAVTPEAFPTSDQLEVMVKSGDITAKGANSARALMQKKNVTESQDKFNLLMMQAQGTDFTVEKNPEQTVREWKDEAAALPSALQRRFAQFADNRLAQAKKKGEAEEKPVEKIIYQQMNEDREKNGLTVPMVAEPGSTHWYGSDTPTTFSHVPGGLEGLRKMSDDEIREKFGEKATRESVLRDEQQHYANQQAKMRDWFKANPAATEEQAQEYRMKIEKPYVSAAISGILRKSMPVGVHTREEYEALPSGAVFIWNGRTGTVP